MRSYAADDFATIKGRVADIRTEECPRCPMQKEKLLFDCLRSSAPCGGDCPHKNDCIGPQPSG